MSWARETPAQGNGAAHITVNDTVYGVLHNHRSLMSIKENREVLEHELSKARAGFGPRVDVTGEIGVGVLSDTTSRGLDLDDQWLSVGSVSAKLVQPIWDGFATRSRVRTAQATLDSVKARVFNTATSLSLDGIIAHIDLLRRIKLVELARNNVARHETILAQARDRASMGADTQADVTQAESRLQRAHSSLSEAEDALRVAYATYSRLTGIYTVGRLDVVPMPAQMPDTAAAFIQMAEKHNPKLAAYLQDIRAAKGEKELAQSAMYPTFQLEAGPEYSDRGGDRDRWLYSFDVLATVRWNVFNSGADVAGIRAASAREREARQNLYDYMDTLRLDMESTWSNYLAAKEQYKFYTRAVENNTYTRQAYHDQFLLGTRSLLDVLDSENELYNSASQAETARGNILVGAYRMCALAGDLLPRMGVPAEEDRVGSQGGPPRPGGRFRTGLVQVSSTCGLLEPGFPVPGSVVLPGTGLLQDNRQDTFCLLFCGRTSTGWTSKDRLYVGKRIRGNTGPGDGGRGTASFRCRFHAAFAAQPFFFVPPPRQGTVPPVPAGRAFGQHRLGPGMPAGGPQGGADGQCAVPSPAG